MRHWLSNNFFRFSIFLLMSAFFQNSVDAQYVFSNDSAYKAGQENTGRLWGYAFGDFAYKTHADSLKSWWCKSVLQEFPRIVMNSLSVVFTWVTIIISVKNSQPACYWPLRTIFLPASPPANGTFVLNSNGSSTGDLTLNNKLTFFIKQMFSAGKGFVREPIFLVGQFTTPSFPELSEKVWSYRVYRKNNH